MAGNARGPSTAFCLLFKFFTMKLTEKQIVDLLDHADSPYIRAVRPSAFDAGAAVQLSRPVHHFVLLQSLKIDENA